MEEDVVFESAVDLFEAADSLSRLLGCPVVVEDNDFRVLAYSAVEGQPQDSGRNDAIIKRRTPDIWQRWLHESGIRQRLLTTREVVPLQGPWPGFRHRLITAIRAGTHVVGFLWVMDGDRGVPDDVTEIMHEFADFFGLEIARRTGTEGQSPENHLLRQFLGGAIPAADVAEFLHVSEDVSVLVLGIQLLEDGANGVWLRQRALKALSFRSPSRGATGMLTASMGQQICVLRVVPHNVSPAQIEADVASVVRRLEAAVDIPFKVSVSSVKPGLASTSRLWQEARFALGVLVADTNRTVGTFPQLRFRALLREVTGFVKTQSVLTDGTLDALIEHDTRHRSDLVSTVRSYLRAFGDVRQAAQSLHIHPNSLRYRLDRIRTIGGLDLADPEQRLALQLVVLQWSESGGSEQDRPGNDTA